MKKLVGPGPGPDFLLQTKSKLKCPLSLGRQSQRSALTVAGAGSLTHSASHWVGSLTGPLTQKVRCPRHWGPTIASRRSTHTEVHMLGSSTPDKAVLGSWTCTMRERHQVLDWWRHICFGSEKHSQKKGALIPYQVPFQEASSGGAPKEHVRTRALQSTSELCMVCVWNPQNRFKNIKTCNFYKGNYKNAKGIQIICPINPFVGPVYGEPMEDLMSFFKRI